METINGLPAHILLIHAVVVLIPLTALLAIVSAVWRPARERLVWLVLALAVITMILTPITSEAGEWLERRTEESAALENHTELGEWGNWIAAGVLVVAIALAALHVLEKRSGKRNTIATIVVAVLAVVIGVGAMIGIYRIGDSGATAVWGDVDLSQVSG
ncbi:MAG: DUF2231 domain-containing protein [Rhodococcus sp. (in: high G+C Gram-positive bacteria)]